MDDVSALEPEALVRMGCIETLNQGAIEETDKLYHDDATYTNSDGEEGTLEDLKEDSLAFHSTFPDIEAEIDDVIVDDDHVVFYYTARGTFENQFMGLAPNGEQFEAGGIGYARLEDGLIDEYRLVFDRLGTMQQLGVL